MHNHHSDQKHRPPNRGAFPATAAQDQAFSPIAVMRLARAMKPMELDSRDEAILQGDIVLQAYFVIKGRIEAYVHEDGGSRGSWVGVDDDAHPLRQSSFLGVWGPGSLWGLSNIMLGGSSEVRVLHRCIRLSGMRGGIGGPRAVVLEEVLHANVSSNERDRG